MTEQPTGYDLYQDEQIARNTQMIKPDYAQPEGIEYSFPVVGQGISAQQYRLMSLGQANGIIHGDNGIVNTSPDSTGYRYYLDGHATDSETNSNQTLILRAGTSAEAILEGFYHRLTEDMEISFPPVTTPTTYHVCLTYDPSRETERTGPIYVKRYDTTPPTSGDRVHLVLHTVHRNPNELLSNAQITRYRQYTAGLLSVQNTDQLPDVDSVPAGTLAVPSSADATGLYVRSNTSPKQWLNTLVGPWEDIPNFGGWDYSYRKYRHTVSGVEVLIRAKKSRDGNNTRIGKLPFTLKQEFNGPVFIGERSARVVSVKPDGEISWSGGDITTGWVNMSFIIPDYFI